MKRSSSILRKTNETDIKVELNLDGPGKVSVDTGIPFLDHMLNLTAAHGFLDINIKANGDTDIDYHHTIEDLGICLGMAVSEALEDKKGIKRYGQATVPMDEAMSSVVIDISNRPYLAYRVSTENSKTGNFDIRLLEEFFRAFVNSSGITMHVDLLAGKDAHHVAESVFKAFGRALDIAAGNGRNAIFLAKQSIEVDAVDISDIALARLSGVHPRLHPLCADFDAFDIPENRYSLILNIRFLSRRLFPYIKEGLIPGGLLIFETYLDAPSVKNSDSFCREYLLRPNELLHAFLSLRIIFYEEQLSHKSDNQRPVASLVAVKPAES